MKRLLLTLFMLLTYVGAQSQATQVWCENFDGTLSTTSSGTPGWSTDVNYFTSPANSIKGEYGASGIVTLTSPTFSTLGQNFVLLEFKQICKIEFSDPGTIEFSLDGGATWQVFDDNPTKITTGGSGNCYYQGTGVYFANNNAFSEGSYIDWAPGTTTAPTQTWWKTENFDVSLALANQANVQIRFKIADVFGGMAGRYGWLLDDICVTAAPCELVDPTVSAPYPGNPLYSGDVYNMGPYDVFISINDPSGISFSDLFWQVNGGATQSYGGMVNLQDSMYAAQIPQCQTENDTICWWVEATDASGCNNFTYFPAPAGTGQYCFVCKSAPTVPFCDNFDIQNNLWTPDPASTGTPWAIGAPTGGALSSAFSTPSVLGVGNVAGSPGYSASVNSFVLSPIFDFSSVTVAEVSLRYNAACEDFWDGTRLEFTTDGGVTWTMIGGANDPNGTNWYNFASLNSSGLPGWAGTSGWTEARYKLCTVPGLMGSINVQFRFVFTSDGSVEEEGFHIDDFCLTLPCTDDLAMTGVVSPPPGSGTPAGASNTVTVSFDNLGINAASGFNIGYSIGGVIQTPVAFGSTVAECSGSTFALPAITAPSGSYTVCAWLELPGDCNNANDTICATYIGIPTFTPSPSYCDDFESGNNGWSSLNGPTGNAGTNWELGAPAFGATTGGNNGSTNAWDINLNSAYTPDAESYLYTPFFDFSAISAGRITFALNYATEPNWDGTRLEFTNDNGATWNTIGQANNDPCGTNWYNEDALISSGTVAWAGTSNGWQESNYKLCCTSGIFNSPTQIQFRFVFTSDPSVQVDGFSIDDFCIYAAQGDDVGISSIVSPTGGFAVGSTNNVQVILENFGATTITSVPISYTVTPGGAVQTIIWNGSLAPCDQITVTLPPFTMVAGVNTITAYTSLASDVEPSNDTATTDVIGQPIFAPTYSNWFSDNFDSGNIGYAPSIEPGFDPGTIWEFGTPNFGATTGAYSAPNCWDVNLNTAVTGNASTVVTTPFFDFTNAQGAILRFFQNRDMNAFGDEMSIEYNVNNTGWVNLQPTTQITTNWYNNFDSWNDVSGGWIQSIFKDVYSAVGGAVTVQFRFKYTSVAFTNSDGASVDNFEIFVPIPLSVQTVSVNTSVPCQFIFPGQPITFAAPIQNNGINTVFNHNVSLVIDNVLQSVDPVSYTPSGLAPDSTQVHNFNNTWIAVPGFHSVCIYTDTPNGTVDLYQLDDTACTTILVFDSITTSQLPYCTSFESGNQWVTANSFTYCIENDWEMGTPGKANLNGAHTGNNAWSTNLTGTYANKDSSGLFSSLVRVQQGHCYKVSFWQQFRMEYGSDGGAFHYSDDYGSSWNRLDMVGSPNIQLFGASPNYTYVSELDPNSPADKGFTGVRNDWFYTEKVFRPGVDGQIVFRWRFASDYSVVDEGWDIDDVCIEDLGPCAPVGVDEFAMNDFGMSQNFPNPADENTTFEFVIPAKGQVRVVLADMIGQVIDVMVDESLASGLHTIRYNTANLAPGLYTYTLVYEGQQLTKRMLITR